MFAVMADCYAGTRSFHANGRGMYWERDYHTITMVIEETEEEAQQYIDRLGPPTMWVRRAWIQARD